MSKLGLARWAQSTIPHHADNEPYLAIEAQFHMLQRYAKELGTPSADLFTCARGGHVDLQISRRTNHNRRMNTDGEDAVLAPQ